MNTIKRLKVSAGLSLMVWGLLSVGVAIALATAAPVTFSFTGALSDVQASMFPTYNTGQTLTGSYTFNSLTADSNPSSNIGRYNGTIQALTVSLKSYTATLGNSGSNFIQIRNQPSSDRYEVQAPLTGPLVNGFSPLRFRIELIGPSATVSSNDLFPTTPPSLSFFATSRFQIIFEDGNGTAQVRGSLTSLTAVPLPSGVILLGRRTHLVGGSRCGRPEKSSRDSGTEERHVRSTGGLVPSSWGCQASSIWRTRPGLSLFSSLPLTSFPVEYRNTSIYSARREQGSIRTKTWSA